MQTIAEKVIAFNKALTYPDTLPSGFAVLNPFAGNTEGVVAMEQFYRKYYDDHRPRKFIVGINPSRHGAGLTGVPFTDTKRLASVCGIEMQNVSSHELSSVFMYDMMEEYGGVGKFYSRLYINSPFPLAIVRETPQHKWLNANYYDDHSLFEAVKPFMVRMLKAHIALGLDTSKVFVLGKKNELFLNKINKTEKLFGELVTLEHPRYIQQYKLRSRQVYIDKYITLLNE